MKFWLGVALLLLSLAACDDAVMGVGGCTYFDGEVAVSFAESTSTAFAKSFLDGLKVPYDSEHLRDGYSLRVAFSRADTLSELQLDELERRLAALWNQESLGRVVYYDLREVHFITGFHGDDPSLRIAQAESLGLRVVAVGKWTKHAVITVSVGEEDEWAAWLQDLSFIDHANQRVSCSYF